MCLIIFAYKVHAEFPLIVAANRDEFYARQTRPADWWQEAPYILAGKDLQAGGTWMGVTRGGRFAAVTNFRDLKSERKDARSRGEIVRAFLEETTEPEKFVKALKPSEYNGFNLIAGDQNRLFYISDRISGYRELAPGIYGLSNHLLDTPWPKVRLARSAFERMIKAEFTAEDLLTVLNSESQAPDKELPETGVGIELERRLSPIFIKSPSYGTRCSTVIMAGSQEVKFVERTYHPEKESFTTLTYLFDVGK